MDIGKDLQRAYDDGYEQGKQDAVKWIPVTERLPEQNGKYLAFALEEENTMDFYYGHWMLHGTDYRRYVTHWMPLPEPPKEDEDD